MRERRFSRVSALGIALVAIVTVLFALLAVEILSDGDAQSPPPGAVELSEGVPIGVQHTQAGALAAADNYLAFASQSIEQDPATFAALVARVYLPAIRSGTLAQARNLRVSDTRNIANYQQGGRAIAIVAARRLDSYTPQTATVTSWLAGLIWGPRLTPRQSWNLVDTTLRWQAGRWLVVSSDTDPTPAPVPAIVYVNGANDRAPAFARLQGMTAPFYGTGG
jgi:hypothetical protein